MSQSFAIIFSAAISEPATKTELGLAMTTNMSASNEQAANGMAVEENDDFFGDQSADALEQESRLREVEVLRRQHMTTGIREGASAAHDQHLQQGFDEGFAEGAKASAQAGFLYV